MEKSEAQLRSELENILQSLDARDMRKLYGWLKLEKPPKTIQELRAAITNHPCEEGIVWSTNKIKSNALPLKGSRNELIRQMLESNNVDGVFKVAPCDQRAWYVQVLNVAQQHEIIAPPPAVLLAQLLQEEQTEEPIQQPEERPIEQSGNARSLQGTETKQLTDDVETKLSEVVEIETNKTLEIVYEMTAAENYDVDMLQLVRKLMDKSRENLASADKSNKLHAKFNKIQASVLKREEHLLLSIVSDVKALKLLVHAVNENNVDDVELSLNTLIKAMSVFEKDLLEAEWIIIDETKASLDMFQKQQEEDDDPAAKRRRFV